MVDTIQNQGKLKKMLFDKNGWNLMDSPLSDLPMLRLSVKLIKQLIKSKQPCLSLFKESKRG